MTDPQPPIDPRCDPSGRLKGSALVGLIALVVAATAPITTRFEGTRLREYKDPLGIATVCDGERVTGKFDPTKIYTKDQCYTLERARMTKEFAPGVVKCMPDLANTLNANVFKAMLDGAYNAGVGGICRSPMARDFNAHRYAQACEDFVGWHTYNLAGLVTRRKYESALCLKAA